MSDGTMIDPGNSEAAAGSNETGSKGKKRSWIIVNLIMLFLGIILFSRGVFEFLTWQKIIPSPQWMQNLNEKLSAPEARNALAFFGPQAIISAALGFWALVAGILMFRNSKTGWGMALVILSTMALIGISMIVTWFTVPDSFNPTYWPNWISVLTVLIGLTGFFWLLFNRKLYS